MLSDIREQKRLRDRLAQRKYRSTPEYKAKRTAYNSRPEIKARQVKYSKTWLQKHPGYARVSHLKRRYGLTRDRYDAILLEQGGVCPGCGIDNPKYVDHDRGCCPGKKSCGRCVRGIYCMRCNAILGLANDNPEVLDALAARLVSHSRRRS